ncbi:YdaS family helix-turn-helix protein [Vreelandella titanicae]|uniref:YdaS family helix-turn-helix protein n=1 Tax=Vreelandella titanicae TaxID=664683 RepID=UPI003985F035|tara:strand:+ start:208 stop:444 length:237 start_codon:yes stop_codon:yes gene_type:complete
MSQTSTFQNLVGFFGTQIKTAELLKVDQATVSGWVRGKHGMSPAVALRAEKLTNGRFTAAQLCPSVFSEPPINEAASQ